MHRGTRSWPAPDEGKPPYMLAQVRAMAWSGSQQALRHRGGVDKTVSEGIYGRQSLFWLVGQAAVVTWTVSPPHLHIPRTHALLQHPETATQLYISVPLQTVPCACSALTPNWWTLAILQNSQHLCELIPVDWKKCCFPLNYCCILCLRCYFMVNCLLQLTVNSWAYEKVYLSSIKQGRQSI